jgi:hypothetical protein
VPERSSAQAIYGVAWIDGHSQRYECFRQFSPRQLEVVATGVKP